MEPTKPNERVKVLVIMPTRGIIYTEAQESLESELATLNQYPQVIRTTDIPLPHSRNVLFKAALEQDWWTHLLMLDDDIVLPDGAIQESLKRCNEGTDIAVIDYPHHRHDVLEPDREYYGVAVYEEWLEGKPKGKLAWAGLGCVLAKRSACETIYKAEEEPFKGSSIPCGRDDKGRIKMGVRAEPLDIIPSSGEDTYFYLLCRRLGLRVRVVPNMIASHLRMERFVSRLAGGKYTSSHKIAKNTRIDVPGNAIYPLGEV